MDGDYDGNSVPGEKVTDTIINNRYIIIKQLGEGGTGTVYLACDILDNNRYIALKWINDTIIAGTALSLIKKEYEIMTRLKHPNLVRVYSFEYSEAFHKHFITMEYLEGISIQEYIEKYGAVGRDNAFVFLLDLCRALNFIHSRNIIHRDIKPSNIFMYNDTIKIMDFGLSDLDNKSRDIKGTLSYMAPELFTGISDFKVDIFALGVTFYEMISGTSIYKDIKTENIIPLLRDVTGYSHNITAIIESLDDTMGPLLGKMLSFYPEQRYQSCSQIIYDINTLFNKNNLIETAETRDAYVLGAGFVGRNSEFKTLINVVHDTASKVFCVMGEPGIGKSRLFEEFEKYCRLHEKLFYTGNCQQEYKKILDPFIPIFNELLLRACPDSINTYGSQLKKVLPDHEVLKDIERAPTQEPEVERAVLIGSLVSFLLDYSGTCNCEVVLYINDAQWADELSLFLIESLIHKLHAPTSTGNLHLFLSCRKKRENKLPDILEKYSVDTMTLSLFNENDIYNYIQAIFGATRIGSNLKESIPVIRKKVGGNPFFLQELIKSLVQSDVIIHREITWELIHSIDNVYIPDDLKLLIKNRLDNINLGAHELNIIRVMALLDRGVSFEELNNIIKVPGKLLAELTHVEILKQEIIGNSIYYVPAHELIRSVILNDFENKKELHALIAVNLERYHLADSDNYVEEIAYHYYQAQIKDKAVVYLRKSGDKRLQTCDTAVAIQVFEQLLSCLEESDYKQKLEVLLKLCYVYLIITNDYHKGREIIERAGKLARYVDDKQLIAQLYEKKGTYYRKSRKNYAKAVFYYKKAIKVYKTLEDKRGCSLVYYLLGIHYSHNARDYQKALHYHSLSLKYARENDHKTLIGNNMSNIGAIKLLTGYFNEAIIYIKSGGKLLIKSGEKRNSAVYYGQLGLAYMAVGDYQNALGNLDKSITISREIGSPWLTLEYLEGKARIYIHFLKIEEALDLIHEGLELINTYTDVFYRVHFIMLLAYVYAYKDRKDEAVMILEEVLHDVDDDFLAVEVYYELWKITNSERYKDKLFNIYKGVKLANLNYYDLKRLMDIEPAFSYLI